MMPMLLAKVTVLFTAALLALFAWKRATAVTRHLLCVCALAGSLLLPITALFPPSVIAIRLPVMAGVVASRTVGHAGSWTSSSVLFAVWGFGALVLLIRLAVGHWRIGQLVRAATPAGTRLLVADVSVPLACGLLRPVVLMPRSSIAWPEWQFDAAVRHERMHIRRMDLQANFLAHLACTVYWFHPLVWMLAARLRSEQEAACDDAVLFSGFEPATYAEALLAVARISTPTILPGCPMTTQTNLKTRITRLLDCRIARTTSRANLLRTGILFAVVLAGIGVLSPRKSSAQEIYKAGGDVTMPRVIYKVDPPYTEEARAAKISGTVVLNMVIEPDGLAHDISIAKGVDPGLDRSAAETVEKWHFAPATLKGEPVAVRATIEINFRLQ